MQPCVKALTKIRGLIYVHARKGVSTEPTRTTRGTDVSRSIHRRTFLTTAAALAGAVALPATAARAAAAPRISTAFTLPEDRAYPEGIALDARTGDAYVGSYTPGAG